MRDILFNRQSNKRKPIFNITQVAGVGFVYQLDENPAHFPEFIDNLSPLKTANAKK
jgi:hypothetical protein